MQARPSTSWPSSIRQASLVSIIGLVRAVFAIVMAIAIGLIMAVAFRVYDEEIRAKAQGPMPAAGGGVERPRRVTLSFFSAVRPHPRDRGVATGLHAQAGSSLPAHRRYCYPADLLFRERRGDRMGGYDRITIVSPQNSVSKKGGWMTPVFARSNCLPG